MHGPLPFGLVRSALVAGSRYGLSCLGCSVGLMVAMAAVGMASLGWAVVLAGVVLVDKLAPAPNLLPTRVLAAALIGSALLYASTA